MTSLVDPMTTPPAAVATSPESGVAETLRRLASDGLALEANNRAASTRRAYGGDFAHFADWCTTIDAPVLPANPEVVYLCLTALVADANARATRCPPWSDAWPPSPMCMRSTAMGSRRPDT